MTYGEHIYTTLSHKENTHINRHMENIETTNISIFSNL